MKNLKKKIPMLGIAAILAIALIGGTFAYFSQNSTASNYLEASAYDSTLTENFVPPEDGNFTPGVVVPKEVAVQNTGNVGMLVRIQYLESWNAIPVGLTYADAVAGYYDGATETDSFVSKLAGATGTDTGNWVYGGDGYYYYTAELAPGATTDMFIQSIMLKGSSSVGTQTYSGTYWNELGDVTVPFSDLAVKPTDADAVSAYGVGSYVSSVVENTTISFDQLGKYELTFNVETVQAVSEAALIWQGSATVESIDTFLGTIN